MGTKFNSQICTSRSQSERLLALGLKKETADMYYEMIAEGELPRIMPHTSEIEYFQLWDSITPAWSLHRLMELMLCEPWYKVTFVLGDDPYELMVRAMEWHKEYLNKEYLNEHQVVVNEYGKLCSEVEEHCKGVMEYLDYIREED